jgi:copper chaperone CopZ
MSIPRIAFLLPAAILAGCAASSSSTGSSAASSMEEGIIHPATGADIAAAHSDTPLTADTAVLYVNGLGCPLCATNVDKQLVRLAGVKRADVDLSAGVVTIGLAGEDRPSPAALAAAVEDAGFTLVRIETR